MMKFTPRVRGGRVHKPWMVSPIIYPCFGIVNLTLHHCHNSLSLLFVRMLFRETGHCVMIASMARLLSGTGTHFVRQFGATVMDTTCPTGPTRVWRQASELLLSKCQRATVCHQDTMQCRLGLLPHYSQYRHHACMGFMSI
jgi:hypothetical protein